MKKTIVSLILIFVLLLILICIIKQKKNNINTPYRNYMINNDLNNNIGRILVNMWFSSILVKDHNQLFNMLHSKSQITSYNGTAQNPNKILDLVKKIDIHPAYKIKNLNCTVTNNIMTITHELYQPETNIRYNSIFSLVKDSYFKWKVATWAFNPKTN